MEILFGERKLSLIKNLSSILSLDSEHVNDFLYAAPQKYKVYKIPKRTYGYRTIAHPSKDLKRYQYAFLDLFDLPYHTNAMAYVKNKSIKDNALAHKNNAYLLKMDFQDFFNSIIPTSFWNILKKTTELKYQDFTVKQMEALNQLSSMNPDERKLVEKILFWSKNRTIDRYLVLSVGAPTSPCVSNFYMFLFDYEISTLLSEIVENDSITYTRYADDLFFSTDEPSLLSSVPSIVSNILLKSYEDKVKINHAKTVFTSKKHGRFVTGVTINNQDELSLGRNRKRYIKHLVHRFVLKQLSEDELYHLKGLLAFGQFIEPQFILSLELKYGIEVLQRIKEINYV